MSELEDSPRADQPPPMEQTTFYVRTDQLEELRAMKRESHVPIGVYARMGLDMVIADYRARKAKQ